MTARRALLIAAAVALGLLAGRLTAGDPPTAGTLHPDPPGPTRLGSGGVGVGYAQTRAGALAANAHYQQALADAAMLRPGEVERRIEAMAAPGYAKAMVRAAEPGAQRMAQGVLGEGLRQGIATVYFGVPVFYRVDAFSPRRAVIRSWGFTVVGNATSAEPGGYFGSSRMELVWVGGDWKIAATRAGFGPTPKLLTPRRGGEGFELIDLIEGMQRYGVAP